MSIAVIDYRHTRRDALDEWLSAKGYDVSPAPARTELHQNPMSVDLLLLHIGEAQEEEGDDIAAIVEEFRNRSWIVCYSGDPARILKFGQVFGDDIGIFPVPVYALDEDFKSVLASVLRELPSRGSMPSSWLKNTVNGFNPDLERRLEVLTTVLSGNIPSQATLDSAGAGISAAVWDWSSPSKSSELLRKTFFGS
jgi:hypothetical protein